MRQLPLSARLTGADDQNVSDGTYSFRFRIYSSESGSTVLWEETKNIAVEGGIFSTLLGSTTSLDSLDFNSDSYYLAIKVGSDNEMSPRKHIGSSPMALNSDRLDGSHASTSGGASIIPMTDSSGNLTIGTGSLTSGALSATTGTFSGAINGLTIASGALSGATTGAFSDTLTLSKATGTGLAVTSNATVGGNLTVTGTVEMTGFKLTTSPVANYALVSDANGVGTWADISSTAGPWTLASLNLYPDTTTYNVALGATNAGTAKLYVNGNVGIGTTAPNYKLDVAGTTHATGAVTFDSTLGVTGAFTGSSTGSFADTLTLSKATGTGLAVTSNATVGGDLAVTGALSASSLNIPGGVSLGSTGNNVTFASSIIPSTSGLNIGSSTNSFATGYFDNLQVATINTSGTTATAFIINTDQATDNTENQQLRFYLGPVLNTYAALHWTAASNKFDLYSREGTTTYAPLQVAGLTATTGTFSGAVNGLTIASGAISGATTMSMSGQLTSTLATGTAPFSVSSTTLNSNLNADLLDSQHGSYYAPLVSPVFTTPTLGAASATSLALSGALTGATTGAFSDTLTLSKATGTGLSVTSNATIGGTLSVTSTINNATISGGTLSGGTFSGGSISGGTLSATAVNGLSVASGAISDATTMSMSGQLTSTLATGTAPFVVASTTPVANLSIGGNAATVTGLAVTAGQTLTVTSGGTLGSNAYTSTAYFPNASFTDTAVTGKLITGYTSGAGTVAATDTILQAIQKLNGNTTALVTGVSSVNALTGAVALTGTADRLTISAANVFDISATFEALLGKVANPLSQFASTTSAQLAGVISDETGSGALAFATAPVFTTSISTPSIITASGALTLQPAAGSNVNVSLSTTGDFAVNTNQLYVDTSAGNVGIGTTGPTAVLHLKAGGTGASAAPLKFTSGTNLTTAEAGAMEYDGTSLYFSPSTTRKTIAFLESPSFTTPTLGAASGTSLTAATLYGSASANGTLILQGNSATTGNTATNANMYFNVGDSGATTAMTILNSGNVGIGTTSPGFKLDIQSTANSIMRLGRTGDAAAVTMYSDGTTNRWSTGIQGTAITGNTLDYVLYDETAGAVRLVIKNSSGNVGIGTTGPTAVLHLKAGTATASTAPLKFTSGVNLTTAEAGAMEYDGTSLYFSPSTTRKTIAFLESPSFTTPTLGAASGTSLTAATLYGSASANGTLILQGNSAAAGNTATNANMYFKVGDSGATTAMTILNSGNVGIGTTSPGAPLAVQTAGTTEPLLGTFYAPSLSNDTYVNLSFGVANNTRNSVGFTFGYTSAGSTSNYFGFGINGLANQYQQVANGNSYMGNGTADPTGAGNLVTFLSSGNVGIGTTGPTRILDISQNTNGVASIGLLNANAGASAQSEFRIGSNLTNNTNYLSLAYDNTSNVATAVTGASAVGGFIFQTNASDAPIKFTAGSAGYLAFQIAGSDKVRITSTGNVGIGTTGPNGLLDVSKALSATPSTTGKYLSLSASTLTDNATAASGTAASNVFNAIAQPTLAATNATVTTTDAATMYIANAPAAGTNMTITNAWALWIAGGAARFDGNVVLGGHIKSKQTTAPTIGTPANCGTSPTAAVTAGSTDSAGSFTITAGTDVSTTCDTIITFNAAYATAPKAVILSPGNSATAPARQIYTSATATTTFTVKLNSAPAAGEANVWYYWVIE